MLEYGTENIFLLDSKNRIPASKVFELGVLLQEGTDLPIQYPGKIFTGIDLIYANSSGYKVLNGWSKTVTEYVKDYVSVNQFMR